MSKDDCLDPYTPNASTISKDHTTAPEKGQITVSVGQGYDEALNVSNKIMSGTPGPSIQRSGKGKRKADKIVGEYEHLTHTLCSACMDRCARFDVIELDCKRHDDITQHVYCRAASLISSKPILRILRSDHLAAAVFASCYPLVFSFVHRS